MSDTSKVFFKIVVSNYNNMPYVKKCLDSILQQTFQNFFVAIVDCKSTDMSGKFCEMYARKHEGQIAYAELDTEGDVEKARNHGIAIGPNAEYIWIIDSNNWLCSNDVLDTVSKKAIACNMPDIVQVNAQQYTSKQTTCISQQNDELQQQLAYAAPWLRCIRCNIACSLAFRDEYASLNDLLWHMQLLEAANDTSIEKISTICITHCCANSQLQDASKKDIQRLLHDLAKTNLAKKAAAEYRDSIVKVLARKSTAANDAADNEHDALANDCLSMPVISSCKDTERSESLQKDASSDGMFWLRQTYDYLTAGMHKCFIKVIIPCWGIENDICRMLDSILDQTFTDYHIICVEDCSPDKTYSVLKNYKKRHPDKITLMKNPRNLGAGETRNKGHFSTLFSIPSEFEWIVDGDDYIADKHVFQKIYDFYQQNKHVDMINIGWTCEREYSIAKLGWPVGLPGRLIRPWIYVAGLQKNIPFANDVYSHFLMFDKVDDAKIGYLDYNCYIYPKPGRHINGTDKSINVQHELGKALMQYQFCKKSVADELMNGKTQTGLWIKRHFPDFHLKLRNQTRGVSILMASFPFRKKWMLKCIEQLIGQCDNFYLWLNEYTEIPEELKRFDSSKLHVSLSNINLKENGRYLFLNGKCKDDYCLICDDDINYPQNYVENTLECFQRNGDNIVAAYYIHSTSQFLAAHNTDAVQNILLNNPRYVEVPQYRFGLGTAAFIPSKMDFRITQEEILANYDIEMIIGQQCIDRGIRVMTPRRPNGFISFIKNTDPTSKIDKYALHLSGANARTRCTYDYIMKHRNSV